MKNKTFMGLVFLFFSYITLWNAYALGFLDEFNLSHNIVPLSDFQVGGPAKDGIPSIDDPQYIQAKQASFLREADIVIGLELNGKARAYPIKILNWHEIVNDNMDGDNFSVTWCPLTRSALVFNRNIDNTVLEFGVSGLLYNSNLTMYDRNTQALWPQIQAQAVTGQYAGRKLTVIPSIVTTWRQWKKDHPATLVLSTATKFRRDYTIDPYSQYHKSTRTTFPLSQNDNRLPSKELVLGIIVKDVAKAYSISTIQDFKQPLIDTVAEKSIYIYTGPGQTAHITDTEGRLLTATRMYWFAWSEFYKDSLLYQKKDR